MPKNLTTAQVAARLNLTRRAVLARVETGRLSASEKLPGLTGAYLFDAEQIERMAMGDDLADGGVTAALTEHEAGR
nr:MAG TPA_asm: helix-turn-helix domain protein [Caudoviricetes sp.]